MKLPKLPKSPELPKLKIKKQDLYQDTVFLSVPSVKISGKNSPPDRAAVPAGTGSPVGFPAETRDSAGARPCGLAHSVPPTSLGATAMPAAKMSGSQAAGNARLAAVQFGCDSTSRQWMGGDPAGVPSGPDELAEEGTRSYMSQPAV